MQIISLAKYALNYAYLLNDMQYFFWVVYIHVHVIHGDSDGRIMSDKYTDK